MTITLSNVRDQVALRLSDTINLIWSTSTLDEALRAALADLSNAYGTALTLKDLDSALLTTFEGIDLHTLIEGAAAYAVRFRLIEKCDAANPEGEKPETLVQWSTKLMDHFQGLITQVRLRRFAESTDAPHSGWAWEEGSDFS